MIYIELFISFIKVGLFSIGGGYAAIPIIQSQIVETHSWLSMYEFTDLITIAEMTPGPIAVNSATFVGIRIAGIPGAIISTFGCILPSLIIVTLLAHIYFKYKNLDFLQNILSCIRPAIVSLILFSGISIAIQIIFSKKINNFYIDINYIGAFLILFAFILIRKIKLNPIVVMCICGILNLIIKSFI